MPSETDNSQRARVGLFSCVVEERWEQEAVCFWRDGEAFFAFASNGGRHQTVIHADSYIALLEELRETPLPPPHGVLKIRGDFQ